MDPHDLPGLPDLMIVGPGELHDEDLSLLGHQSVAHFGEPWVTAHNDCVAELGSLLGASLPPYIVPGTGTTCLDAAMMNLFSPGDRVVVLDTGFFGNRLVEIATAQRLDVVVERVPIGEPVDAARAATLAPGAAGVLVCHVDTSTGVRHPIREIAATAREAGALTMVDGIASVGGERCDVDGWGIDCLVTSTQKGLECTPAFGIIALGARGRAHIDSRESPPTFYLDLKRWDWYRENWPHHPHPVTMPATVLLALLSSVQRINRTGVDAWVGARAALARRCREGLVALGFDPVPAAGVEANMIVAMHAEDPAAIQKAVLDQGILIAGGLAPLAGRTFRVGLMGRTATEAMVDRLLEAVARAVKER